MPDFTQTEIDLARQLALPREFREGDWVVHQSPLGGDDAYLISEGWRPDSSDRAAFVWLPSIEDCFELLREAERDGWLGTLLEHTCAPDAEKPWFASALWTGDRHTYGFGATPREALYRLLLEVRG